jgi:hypothetical protein
MFVREENISGHTYLYLVESVGARAPRPSSASSKSFARKEVGVGSGELRRLATSVARYAERVVVVSQLEVGKFDGLACKRIGAPLLFGRLWEGTGCRAIIEDRLTARRFEFLVERAVFASGAVSDLGWTGRVRSGWRIMRSVASMAWHCISSTGRGSAMN